MVSLRSSFIQMTLPFTALMALALVSISTSAFGAEVPWHLSGWTRRFQVEIPQEERNKVARVAMLDFSTGVECAPKGADIRVVDGRGGPVHSKLVFLDTGEEPISPDHCILAFEVQDVLSKYYVYCGNPRSPAIKDDWEPNAGLVLETRVAPEGKLDSWELMRALILASNSRKQIIGAGVWPQVFDGMNPFGRSANFISIYRGFIDCPQPGTYLFSTTSTDASFLLVDGAVVAEWPGVHSPQDGQRGEHSGEIIVAAGVHRFEYYNCMRGWKTPACVAAWQTPDNPKFEVIPTKAFPAVYRAAISDHESYNTPVSADFTFSYQSDLPDVEGRPVMVLMKDCSAGRLGLIRECIWKFDDGFLDRLQNPNHVFLSHGPHEVTLFLTLEGGREVSRTHTLSIWPRDYLEEGSKEPDPNAFCEIVKGYPMDALSSEAIRTAEELFRLTGQWSSLITAIKGVLDDPNRAKALKPDKKFQLLMEQGNLLQRYLRQYGESMESYRQAQAYATTPSDELAVRLGMAEVQAAQGEYGLAQTAYQNLLTNPRYSHLDGTREVRTALGNLYQQQGDLPKAIAAYRQAEPYGESRETQIRGFAISVQSCLNRSDYDAALQRLDKWEEQFPSEKFRGETTLYRARSFYGKRDFLAGVQAIRSLLTLVPKPEKDVEIQLALAEGYQALGKTEEANKIKQTISQEHPELKR